MSTKYKAVNDGGGSNIYPQVQRGPRKLLKEEEVEADEEKPNAVSKRGEIYVDTQVVLQAPSEIV